MKKFITFLTISWICLSVSSQNNFADIEKEVDSWLQSVNPAYVINTKGYKSIDFTNHNYSIYGNVVKGALCEGTTAKFYDTHSLEPKLLLEGRVSYNAGRLVIEGIRYLATSKGTNAIYGTFYVCNMDDFTINLKPKKADVLRIKNSEVEYLKGLYRDRNFIVRMKDNNTVFLDRKKEGDSFTYLSANVPNVIINDDGSFDIYQILLQVKDGVTMHWDNGLVFKGKVKTKPIEDDIIAFLSLEGQKTLGQYMSSVTLKDGNIVFIQNYDSDNKLLSNESWYVKDNGSISEEDYWNLEKILGHCYLAKWRYRNENYFEGTIKYDIVLNEDSVVTSISTTATKGVFKYPNGDRFEGDVSSTTVGPFFVDGTTFFSDGTRENGNWLGKFKLTDPQWQKVYMCSSPSEARKVAQELVYRNNYPEYDSDGITYFDPIYETQNTLYKGLMIYDKAKNRFICKNDDSKTILEFAVDKKGYRKWEIVYKNNKPKFINEFTWYSNGVVESIKTYSYDTKKIELSCNFFSDGKLRSAYLYGRGNSGENVLRKSKESHPTYGGYTSKLYDLNGKYERATEWRIGECKSLFGGRYGEIMAPEHLKIGELKPIKDK